MTVDEGVEVAVVSSWTTGTVDGPGNDIGDNSSSGDEGKMGGIEGKLLDFDGESNEVKESDVLLASIEREKLDGSEEDEGSGAISSVISSSVIGLKTGGIGSGDSAISIRIEEEPELVDG